MQVHLRNISPHRERIGSPSSFLKSLRQGEEAPQLIKGTVSCHIDLTSVAENHFPQIPVMHGKWNNFEELPSPVKSTGSWLQ